jgi:hypothetical protein
MSFERSRRPTFEVPTNPHRITPNDVFTALDRFSMVYQTLNVGSFRVVEAVAGKQQWTRFNGKTNIETNGGQIIDHGVEVERVLVVLNVTGEGERYDLRERLNVAGAEWESANAGKRLGYECIYAEDEYELNRSWRPFMEDNLRRDYDLVGEIAGLQKSREVAA